MKNFNLNDDKKIGIRIRQDKTQASLGFGYYLITRRRPFPTVGKTHNSLNGFLNNLAEKESSYNIMILSTEGELYCSYFFIFKMKIVKTQVILFMYEKLLMKRELYSKEVKEKFELEDKTFYRYIQEIRAYYSNMYKKEKIIYCRSEGKYVLK